MEHHAVAADEQQVDERVEHKEFEHIKGEDGLNVAEPSETNEDEQEED